MSDEMEKMRAMAAGIGKDDIPDGIKEGLDNLSRRMKEFDGVRATVKHMLTTLHEQDVNQSLLNSTSELMYNMLKIAAKAAADQAGVMDDKEVAGSFISGFALSTIAVLLGNIFDEFELGYMDDDDQPKFFDYAQKMHMLMMLLEIFEDDDEEDDDATQE